MRINVRIVFALNIRDWVENVLPKELLKQFSEGNASENMNPRQTSLDGAATHRKLLRSPSLT